MSRYLNIKHLIPSASDATVLRYVGAAGIISAFAVALQPQPTFVHAQTEKKKTQERKIKTFKSGDRPPALPTGQQDNAGESVFAALGG